MSPPTKIGLPCLLRVRSRHYDQIQLKDRFGAESGRTSGHNSETSTSSTATLFAHRSALGSMRCGRFSMADGCLLSQAEDLQRECVVVRPLLQALEACSRPGVTGIHVHLQEKRPASRFIAHSGDPLRWFPVSHAIVRQPPGREYGWVFGVAADVVVW